MRFYGKKDVTDALEMVFVSKTEFDRLHTAASSVLWKLERKEETPKGIEWAKIDRRDATILELRRIMIALD